MADYNAIIKEQQQGKFDMVYFLQGAEPFFIDNVIENIELNALDDSQKSFNQYVLYGKETNLTDILNIARKYPMMGERQVVIVKEAQEMRGWNKWLCLPGSHYGGIFPVSRSLLRIGAGVYYFAGDRFDLLPGRAAINTCAAADHGCKRLFCFVVGDCHYCSTVNDGGWGSPYRTAPQDNNPS